MQHPQAIGKSIASQQRQLRSSVAGYPAVNGNANTNGSAHRSSNGNGSGQTRRRSNSGYRGQQQPQYEPIVWDDVQTATRAYKELSFDE